MPRTDMIALRAMSRRSPAGRRPASVTLWLSTPPSSGPRAPEPLALLAPSLPETITTNVQLARIPWLLFKHEPSIDRRLVPGLLSGGANRVREHVACARDRQDWPPLVVKVDGHVPLLPSVRDH